MKRLRRPAPVLFLIAVIAGCGFGVSRLSREASSAGRPGKTLLARGAFPLLMQRTPPRRTPAVKRPVIRPTLTLRATHGRNLVRGYLAVAVGRSPEAERGGFYAREYDPKTIYLPRVTVWLQHAGGARSEPVTTDLSGRFTLLAPARTSYTLCWKADLYDGCLDGSFAAGAEPLFLSTVLIPVQKRDGYTAMFGEVRFEDESRPRMLQPLSGINAFALVTLLDSGGKPLGEVPVNNAGDYLFPYVPNKEAVQLTARIERGEGTLQLQPEYFRRNTRVVRAHLRIENHPPKLDGIVPVSMATGRRARNPQPGDTIAMEVQANDRDGDPVEITWTTSSEGGTLSSTTGRGVRWELPKSRGLHEVEVIASDGKGGYDRRTVRLAVGAPGVAFSGWVTGSDGAPVPGAEVEINGAVHKSDPMGWLSAYVSDADRYVLNIRKEGYGFYSKIYERGARGERWMLARASVTPFDPNAGGTITEKRDRRNCRGPDSARVNWSESPVLQQVWYQDGKGNNVPPPVSRERRGPVLPWQRQRVDGCGPGMTITIPPGALQRAGGGAPAPGAGTASLTTIDLETPDQMPGDYSVERPDGTIAWMRSYGAGSVELRDAAGQPLQLRTGFTADVVIPADRNELASGTPPPPSSPLLRYDEVRGLWREEGVLTFDPARQSYVTKVKRFSSLNVDLVFTNPSCVRVESTIAPPYDLEVTIPMPGGGAPKVKKLTITDAPPHVLYNLPNNTDITLVAISTGPPVQSLGLFVVNTGPPHAGGFGTPPPATACATTVTLSNQVFPEVPNSGEFLHGLFSFAGTVIQEADLADPASLSSQLDQATTNYYNRVDPLGDRATFTGFRDTNGFTKPPGFQLCAGVPCEDPDTEINVTFANSGDLGFGRDMHCRRTDTGAGTGFDYACYVTNYGFLENDDQDDADRARNNTPELNQATVAMEYSRISPGDALTNRQVKFYVYVGDTRVNRANLDGKGARPIPQLCMVCHGGAYPGGATTGVPAFGDAASVRLNSRFLPFDLRFYTFSTTAPGKTAQQSAFKRLNQDIVRNAPSIPAPDPIADIIDQMYLGGVTDQREEFVVPGWAQTTLPNTVAQERFYSRVIGNACRTCHVAQPFANVSVERAGVDLQFRTARDYVRRQSISGGGSFSPFTGAEVRVCTEHVMPHAKRTHDLFWTRYWTPNFGAFSPTLAAQFQAFGTAISTLPRPGAWPMAESWPPSWSGQLCGPYTSGGVTPPSFYSAFVHPLLTRNYGTGAASGCGTCHDLNGSAAQTRTALLTNYDGSGSGVVTVNDAANSVVIRKLLGTLGSRMPLNCPSATRRCLNEAGGVYNPAADPNPNNTATEVDRFKHWINTGALP